MCDLQLLSYIPLCLLQHLFQYPHEQQEPHHLHSCVDDIPKEVSQHGLESWHFSITWEVIDVNNKVPVAFPCICNHIEIKKMKLGGLSQSFCYAVNEIHGGHLGLFYECIFIPSNKV